MAEIAEIEISEEYYFTAANGVLYACDIADSAPGSLDVLGKITFCVLILACGGEAVGESICADPTLSDPDAERAAAKRRALVRAYARHGAPGRLGGLA
ncbi:Gp49 family protein [Chromobacterium amazonense]|uniref:Gp49 family protein n=1 Tax=Chromobacterium amazonense TaxID=1382803 RepID=UPI00237D9C51|nr:Gp49 family protein [Chromobacterium amazonense]MDE1715733.1 Gp49 family protein [Chromobacterium amazonense]